MNPPLRNGLRGKSIEKHLTSFSQKRVNELLSFPPFISSFEFRSHLSVQCSELKFQKVVFILQNLFDGWEGKHFYRPTPPQSDLQLSY
jgi:hypothetical protein